MSEKTIYALNELKKEHLIFIASGRSKCMLPKDVLAINPDGFVCANGAYVEYNGEVLYEKAFDHDELKEMKTFCDNNGINYYFETQDTIYTRDTKNDLHIRFNESWDMNEVFSEEDYLPSDHIHIIMMACNDEEACRKLENEFKGRYDVRKHTGFPSYDINFFGNHKGYGINEVLKRLDIPKEEAYAFGDGLNDVEMLKSVKYGIAMGNAKDELKTIAYEQTDDVLNDGIYNWLLKEGLIKGK